eukprot:6000842-Pyramimonas_sp.AAC.1
MARLQRLASRLQVCWAPRADPGAPRLFGAGFVADSVPRARRGTSALGIARGCALSMLRRAQFPPCPVAHRQLGVCRAAASRICARA